MNRRAKKKGNRSRGKKNSRSSLKKKKETLPERITNIFLKILAYLGLSALAFLVLTFLISTLLAWLLEPRIEKPMPIDVSLEVLNGCGDTGAAKGMTSILRKNGFLVTDFRNADNFDYELTILKVRDGDFERGEQLAKQIGCDSVRFEPATDATADISIIIGRDWRELKLVTGEKDPRERLTAILDFFTEFH